MDLVEINTVLTLESVPAFTIFVSDEHQSQQHVAELWRIS
jgi:hypothetical protein